MFDVQLTLNNTENYQFSKFSQIKQMLIKTNILNKQPSNKNQTGKIISLANVNKDFYSLNQNFDITYLFCDKFDFQKDRKMTKNIIENQFFNKNNKKRTFAEMKTQFNVNENPDFLQLMSITNFNEKEIELLENVDSQQFFKFYTKFNLQKIESTSDLKEIVFSNPNMLLKYCIFANHYIFPKFSEESYNKVVFLGETLKSSFSMLKSSDFEILSKSVRLLTMYSIFLHFFRMFFNLFFKK